MPSPGRAPAWGWRKLLVAVGMGAALGLAACGDSSNPASSSSSSGAGGGVPLAITARDFAFQPNTLTVGPSAQVTVSLRNASGKNQHSFVTTSGPSADIDVEAGQTKSTSFTVPASGTVTFHCKYHPVSMTGTITIGSGPVGGETPSVAPSGGSGPGQQGTGPGSGSVGRPSSQPGAGAPGY